MDVKANAKGAVIHPDARTPVVPVEGIELQVKVLELVRGHEGDDHVSVRCEYPQGFVKDHQLFDKDPVDAIMPVVIQTFRVLYGVHVSPVAPPPARDALEGAVIQFKEAE